MRKLGIILAVMIAATLGYSGTASADGHEEELCPNITGNPIAEGAAENDGEPLVSTFEGAEETCRQSNSTDGLAPSPLLCGVTDGLTNAGVPDPPAGVPAAINDGAVDNGANDLPVATFEKCAGAPGDDDDDDPDVTPSGDDDDDDDTVKSNNAAADGSLPRTGGELFAGAGFGLMSLGALVRRFLP